MTSTVPQCAAPKVYAFIPVASVLMQTARLPVCRVSLAIATDSWKGQNKKHHVCGSSAFRLCLRHVSSVKKTKYRNGRRVEQLKKNRVKMTTESSKNGAITWSRMNFSAYLGHVTIFS